MLLMPPPRRARARFRSRHLGLALVGCGAAMVPWLVVLGRTLPDTAQVRHWSTAWVGLDALEALGLTVTGRLLLRRDPRHGLTATATAALLVVDAWFDVTTAAPGPELTTAVAMALGAELPMAALCTTLAVRALPARAVDFTDGPEAGWRRPVVCARPGRWGVPWPPLGPCRSGADGAGGPAGRGGSAPSSASRACVEDQRRRRPRERRHEPAEPAAGVVSSACPSGRPCGTRPGR
jgi:hypothetical protein